jgi:2-polyprenyl-3-methyl-5-hydroxy-6-metoxy-1,4-benzoquinol methylase
MASNKGDKNARFHAWDQDAQGADDDGFVGHDTVDEEDEVVAVKSLFDGGVVYGSLDELISKDKAEFGFDLKEAIGSIDGYDDPMKLIMLVNFIRSEVRNYDELKEPINTMKLKFDISKKEFLSDEKYMIPVVSEDQLLVLIQELCGIDDEDDDGDDFQAPRQQQQPSVNPGLAVTNTSSVESSVVAEQERVINDLRARLARYEAMIANLASDDSMDANDAAAANNSSGSNEQGDGYYFDGYSHLSIHETMLRDTPRTSGYANAILANREYLKGKVVLDVGCGTGILSLLAAKAGAKKVIGVDLSRITSKTERIIEKNGFKDVITVVHGRLETVELPLADDEKVDVIISEWMGYALYFENMLSSVLFARDKYLAPNGILMPSKCSLFIEAFACADTEDDRVRWWRSVYGFDLSEVQDMLTTEAQVQFLASEDVVSDRVRFHELDIRAAEDMDLDFECDFDLVIAAVV